MSSASGSPILFRLGNGTYSYKVGPIVGFTASPSSGSFVVAGRVQLIDLTFTKSTE